MRIRWAALGAMVAALGLLLAGCGQQQAAWHPPSFPSGNPVAGAQIYKSTCSICHGPAGLGVSGTYPALRNNAAIFQLERTEPQLAAFIQDYMPKTNPGSLTKTQAADLAAFIYGINGKLGTSIQTQLLALLPSTKPVKPSTGNALTAEIAAGQQLFASVCSVCHGKTGQGFATKTYPAPGLWPPAATAAAVKSMGLSGLTTFIQQNMPLVPTHGVSRGSLTATQATDLAEFILSHK